MKVMPTVKFYLSHPSYLPLFLSRLMKGIRTRVRIKVFGLYSHHWYPKEIKKECELISPALPSDHYSARCFKLIKSHLQWNEEVYLAGLSIDFGKFSEAWRGNLEKDPEVLFASHRFHWILEASQAGLSENQQALIYQTIEEWSRTNHRQEAKEPYSISERICNLSVFFWLHEKKIFSINARKKFILSLIHDQTMQLLTRLEYPASNIINNHILNNARALFISGVLFKNRKLRNLSYNIFKKERHGLIDDNGFLKECSTHYQLLLSKNIRELATLESEIAESSYFTDLSQRMNNATLSLSSSAQVTPSSFAKIGDISPDIPADWYSLTSEAPWGKIWKGVGHFHETPLSSGWVSLKSSNWFSLSQSHELTGPYALGHGHDDYGSFTLSYQGTPIIIDRGRRTYSSNEGTERKDHNTICEGTKLQIFKGAGLKEAASIHSKKKLRTKVTCDKINFEVKDHWSRSLSLDSNNFIIEDNYISSIYSTLYFSPRLKIEQRSQGEIHLKGDDLSFLIKFEGDRVTTSLSSTTAFLTYGQSTKSTCLKWSGSGSVIIRISCDT